MGGSNALRMKKPGVIFNPFFRFLLSISKKWTAVVLSQEGIKLINIFLGSCRETIPLAVFCFCHDVKMTFSGAAPRGV
jgi:hypothetical protein